ncbi:MAG: aldehyde dehydrogenase family protein [Bacteroidota bacterium]
MIATPSQIEQIQQVFEAQKEHQHIVGKTTAAARIKKLKKLHDSVMNHQKEIHEAMYQDFRKHPAEVDLSEIYAVTGEIKHAIKHLKGWMKPQPVETPVAFLGSSSYIHYEPKGVCLIISPWNFPINLTFGPLVSAIAAGNTVIIKPSEHTPHCSAVMQKIVNELFEEKEVALFQGAVDTSTALLDLPFDHIFFTGSPAVGKVVMAAAAKHLSSVTLELGGKSPTIVDETANIKEAATRIAWGTFFNNGQVCIAPDYVYVHESKKEEFLQEIQKTLKEFFGEDPAESPSYARIVNDRHFNRVKDMLDASIEQGAELISGGEYDETQQYLAPTVVTNVPLDSPLMQEEIFGPVLPINTFSNLDEVLKIINSKEKPLTFYIYSKSNTNIQRIIRETRAGTTAINHSVLHFLHNNLPFGGVNNSGIGKSHGKYGFQAFSNGRAIYKQNLPAAMDFLFPPYDDMKKRLIKLTIRYF